MDSKKYDLFLIRDVVADDNGPVFQAVNTQVALRQFKSLLSKAIDARDFELWKVGTIDSNMMIVSDVCQIDVFQLKLEDEKSCGTGSLK